ncbi:outer membrane beta-barrel protein [Geothrix sp. 21YS21S-2]|uniref:outer membrane beta-barrel protein n=1 Tax=Geothrix sp. 21YS21S-2 TaxID=3068893 RepID=UPI0027B8CBB5|nr:outer membrane beta-barrel protein [Geothrix sp. 21YS21S-2]
MSLRPRMLLLAPFLAAAPLAAAEASFGGQIHLAKPLGAFSDSGRLDNRLGFGLGIQAPVDFGAGHILRPKLDYLAFSRGGGDRRYKADSLLLMADYTYFVAEEAEGGYLIAGLGFHSTRLDAAKTFGPVTARGRKTHNGLAYNVGLGYAFNRNVGMEVKYLGMDMGELGYNLPGAYDAGFMANAIVGTLSFRF